MWLSERTDCAIFGKAIGWWQLAYEVKPWEERMKYSFTDMLCLATVAMSAAGLLVLFIMHAK